MPDDGGDRRRPSGSRRSWPTRSPGGAAPTGRRPAGRRSSASIAGSWPSRCATPSRGRRSTSGGATTGTCPRDHPLSNVKPLDDILLAIGLTEEGVAGGRGPGVPLPPANLHPFRTGEAIGGSRGPAWCAAALADELADAHASPADGPGPASTCSCSASGADGHVLSVFPGSAALGAAELALAIPAPTHIEPHVERVTLNPAVIGAARQRAGGRGRRRQRRRSWPRSSARPATRPAGRPSSPGARRPPGSSTAPRRRASRAEHPAGARRAPGHVRRTGRRSRCSRAATARRWSWSMARAADHTTFRVVGPRLAALVHRARDRPARARRPRATRCRTRSTASSRTSPRSPARSPTEVGRPVPVFGHSYGGRCALGAALVSDRDRPRHLLRGRAGPAGQQLPAARSSARSCAHGMPRPATSIGLLGEFMTAVVGHDRRRAGRLPGRSDLAGAGGRRGARSRASSMPRRTRPGPSTGSAASASRSSSCSARPAGRSSGRPRSPSTPGWPTAGSSRSPARSTPPTTPTPTSSSTPSGDSWPDATARRAARPACETWRHARDELARLDRRRLLRRRRSRARSSRDGPPVAACRTSSSASWAGSSAAGLPSRWASPTSRASSRRSSWRSSGRSSCGSCSMPSAIPDQRPGRTTISR